MSELDGICLPRTDFDRQIDTIRKCLDETRNEEIKKLSEIDIDLYEIVSNALMKCQEESGDLDPSRLDPSRVAVQVKTELNLLIDMIEKAKLAYLEPIIKNLEEEKDIKDFLRPNGTPTISIRKRNSIWKINIRERLTSPLLSAIESKINSCWQEKINAFLVEQAAMKSEATKEKIVSVNSVNEPI